MDRARKLPGPGQYELPSTMEVGGGKFNDAIVPSDTEVRMARARKLPGPGEYSLPSTLKASGGGFQVRARKACSTLRSEWPWLVVVCTSPPLRESSRTCPAFWETGGTVAEGCLSARLPPGVHLVQACKHMRIRTYAYFCNRTNGARPEAASLARPCRSPSNAQKASRVPSTSCGPA
jgi:hypothetical protein